MLQFTLAGQRQELAELEKRGALSGADLDSQTLGTGKTGVQTLERRMKTAQYFGPLLRPLALIAALAAPTLAQTGIIRGTVLDNEGRPLRGAVVLIERTDMSQHFQAETDSDGEYFLTGVPGGYYRLTLTVDGQAIQYADNFRIRGRRPTDASFDLRTAPVTGESLVLRPAFGKIILGETGAIADTEEGRAAEEERMGSGNRSKRFRSG